jgi:hypothetical protein
MVGSEDKGTYTLDKHMHLCRSVLNTDGTFMSNGVTPRHSKCNVRVHTYVARYILPHLEEGHLVFPFQDLSVDGD